MGGVGVHLTDKNTSGDDQEYKLAKVIIRRIRVSSFEEV